MNIKSPVKATCWTKSVRSHSSIRVAESRPNAIILDLLMPEMDGFQFLAEFRKSESNRTIPVVVVTGADLDEAARQRLSGGVEHVLQKAAYSRDEMLAEVKGLISRYLPEGPLP